MTIYPTKHAQTTMIGPTNMALQYVVMTDDAVALDKFLLKQKASILSFVALYYACQAGKGNIVKYLIEVKQLSPQCSFVHYGKFTGTAIEVAVLAGHSSIVKFMRNALK